MSLSANGACGLSNGQSFFGAPTQYLCASNSALIGSAPSGNGPWSWQCR